MGSMGGSTTTLPSLSLWGFDLETITQPTLLMQGEYDVLVPRDHMAYLASKVPGARLDIVAHGGHTLFDETADVVRDTGFLAVTYFWTFAFGNRLSCLRQLRRSAISHSANERYRNAPGSQLAKNHVSHSPSGVTTLGLSKTTAESPTSETCNAVCKYSARKLPQSCLAPYTRYCLSETGGNSDDGPV